jgi:RNA polymerase sigma-70 factor (ECF subfamily)
VKSRVNRARARLVDLLGLAPGESMDMTDKATMTVIAGGLSTLPFAS